MSQLMQVKLQTFACFGKLHILLRTISNIFAVDHYSMLVLKCCLK